MIKAREVVMKHRGLPPTELSDEQRRGLGEPFAKALKHDMQLLDWHQRAAQADSALNLLDLVDEADYALHQLRPNLPALLRRIPVLAPVVLTSFLATARVTSAEASIPVGAVNRTTLYVSDNSNPETEVQLAAVEQTSSELIVAGVVNVRTGPGTQYPRVDQLRPGDRIPLSQIKCRVYSGGLWWLERTDGTWFAKVGSIAGNISTIPVESMSVSQPASQETPATTQRLTNNSNVNMPIVNLSTGATIGYLAPGQSTLVTGQSGYYYTLVSGGGIHISNPVYLSPVEAPTAPTAPTSPESRPIAFEQIFRSLDLSGANGGILSYDMSLGYDTLSSRPVRYYIPPKSAQFGSPYTVRLYKIVGATIDYGSYYAVPVQTVDGSQQTIQIPKVARILYKTSGSPSPFSGYSAFDTNYTSVLPSYLDTGVIGYGNETLMLSS